MNSENNNFNNNDELKNSNKPNETVEENSINYSAVSGTKEYIYTHGENSGQNNTGINNNNNNEFAREPVYENSTESGYESIYDSNNTFESSQNAQNSQYTQNTQSTQYTQNNYNGQNTQSAQYAQNDYNTQNAQNFQQSSSNAQNSNFEYKVNDETKSKPKKSFTKILPTIAAVLVVSLVSGAAGGFMTSYYYKNGTSSNGSGNVNNSEKQNIAINLSQDAYFAAAVNEKAKDTVVGITTTTVQSYNSFWGGKQEQDLQSIGSGVIVDPNGLILTNSHVIGDGQAKSIIVSLVDGTSEEAQVLWYDATLDLAVIKINRTDLSCAELGDSDTIIVGEPVVAIGNPMSLDLNGTLTTGVISGLNRSITVENTTIKPLIQTDASINPGNSGGPLFNAEGKVIGINTAKMSTAEGLGFSIPINVAIPILSQLTNGGTVSSVYIGITGTSVSDYEQRLGIDLTAESGVIVVEVVKDGPVYKAGLTAGDVIVSIDDTQIKDMSDLKRALYQYKTGDKAQVKYIRDGNENTIEITLQEKPKDL